MNDGPKVGLQAAIDGEAPAAPDDGEQLPLLPLPLQSLDAAGQVVEIKRGPGRPPGAKNKRTEAWLEWFGRQYRAPLEVLGQMISLPVDRLAQQLGCSAHDAVKLQLEAARALLPYVHQKQPMAVDLKAEKSITLTFEMSGAPAVGSEPGVKVLQGTIVENQEVTGKAAVELDGGELDGGE